MTVKFKSNKSTRKTVSKEGFIGDLFGKLFGASGQGQVETMFDAQVMLKIVDVFNQTYLSEEWLSNREETGGNVLVNIKAISFNDKYPTSLPGAFEKFVNDFDLYAKKYLPILERYHRDMGKLLKETLKLRYASDMVEFAKPKILALRGELIKHAPTFPMPGMALTDNKEKIVHLKKDVRQVKALTKKEIVDLSHSIIKFIKSYEAHQKVLYEVDGLDFEDLVEDELSDYIEDEEDDVYDLAGMFDTNNGYIGDYITDIEVKIPRALRTIDLLMTRSLK